MATIVGSGVHVWRRISRFDARADAYFVVETSSGPLVLCEVVQCLECGPDGKAISGGIKETPIKADDLPFVGR